MNTLHHIKINKKNTLFTKHDHEKDEKINIRKLQILQRHFSPYHVFINFLKEQTEEAIFIFLAGNSKDAASKR